MPTSTHRSAHATTGTTAAGWSTAQIAICALFVAAAMVASYIEIPVPPVVWLKYDPSGAVCLLAGMVFGAGTGSLVAVLSQLPHVFMDPWGGLMSIICALALVLPASLLFARVRGKAGFFASLVLGAVVTLAVACVANVIVTPLYTPTMTAADVVALIVPVLLPFNLIKVALNCAITTLVYKPASKLAKK